MEGDLNIHCCISEPFKFHSQYREQYIGLWRKLIDFCEKKCVRYYTSNLVNGDTELRSQERDWTQEEREKVKVDFIDEDAKRELEKILNFYLQKRFVSCIIVFVVDEDDKYIGISPSGKALDSDSSIRGFESLYPSS